jgi:hypothetical protein
VILLAKIRMTETRLGSPNGIEVKTYVEGTVLSVPTDIPVSLAEVFLREKWAEKFKIAPEEKKISGPVEEK